MSTTARLVFTCIVSALLFPSALGAGTADVSVQVRFFECDDGVDNDGDALIDYPDDAGCDNATDDDETDMAVPQCSDGSDNDGDGRTDYPADPGCDSVNDNNEINLSGGGSGGGSTSSRSEAASVTFSGRAYPLSTIIILQDGEEVLRTIAGPDARFTAALQDVVAGTSVFSAYAEDSESRRSTLFTTSLRLSDNTETTISGVFLPPTVDTDKMEVRRGDDIAIFGKSGPSAPIVVQVNSREPQFLNTVSDDDGVYFASFDTSLLEMGSHTAKAKENIADAVTQYGAVISFTVGTRNILRQARLPTIRKGDLNEDGQVNLTDFSVAAFWYQRALSGSIVSRERERLNGDGKINLTDFSIMAFQWSG